MQEIIKLVSQKTGLPEAQAKLAVETVVTFIKGKLPAPLASSDRRRDRWRRHARSRQARRRPRRDVRQRVIGLSATGSAIGEA